MHLENLAPYAPDLENLAFLEDNFIMNTLFEDTGAALRVDVVGPWQTLEA